ncbi:MAG: hypothetical protein SFU99_10195 [Saprospiraceae bacterium]|nr:hypothetical protein [Saprospiraceae bacterium]
MKALECIFIIFILCLSLISQAQNKIEFRDTLSDYEKILNDNIDKEVLEMLDSLDFEKTSMGLGILEFINIDSQSVDKKGFKSHSICQCYKIQDTIFIANAIGFMAGLGSIIKINSIDSTYESSIFFATDDVKQHKFKENEELIADIEVPLERNNLLISKQSEFSNQKDIVGILEGVSIEFYEGNNKVKLQVRSIFKCKFEDYNILLKKEGKKKN